MTVFERERFSLAFLLSFLLAAAWLLGSAFGAIPGSSQPIRAGTGTCSLLVSSTTDPTPGPSATVTPGDDVTFEGSGFAPSIDIQIAIYRNGVPSGGTSAEVNSGGAFIFFESFTPSEVSDWTFEADDGSCVSSAVAMVVSPPSACPLVEWTDASPTPSTWKQVEVGQELHLQGSGFTPNEDIDLEFLFEDELVDVIPESANGSGSFSLDVTFPDPPQIGAWAITANEAGGCSSTAYVSVVPDGPVGSVTIGTFICPPGVQSRAQVEAAASQPCKVGVLPPDQITPPGHTSNLQAAEFDYELISTDGYPWTLVDMRRNGGGFCNPTTKVCSYLFNYRSDFVATGEASLQLTDPPAGYRFGYGLVDDDMGGMTDPLSTDVGTGTMTFDVPEDFTDTVAYLFANWGTSRMAGADRFKTAAAVSSGTFDPGVPVAYIANGLNFPDALAGGVPAALEGGPLLLVSPTALPAATAAELTRLQPDRIVILGGTGSVGNTVATALDAYTSGSVTRLAGANRYATAAAVSAATFDPGVPVAYISNGLNFPDALAGGVAAALDGGPLLLTNPTSLPSETTAELTRLNPAKIVILGGTASVSNAVQTALDPFTAGSVTRLAGANRYATAAAVSAATFDPGVAVAYIANGLNFPDALAGAVPAVLSGGPLLLVSPTSLPSETAAELTRLNPGRIVILGGTGSVSNAVQTTLNGYADPAP